eukprot:gene22407-biopygen5745
MRGAASVPLQPWPPLRPLCSRNSPAIAPPSARPVRKGPGVHWGSGETAAERCGPPPPLSPKGGRVPRRGKGGCVWPGLPESSRVCVDLYPDLCAVRLNPRGACYCDGGGVRPC